MEKKRRSFWPYAFAVGFLAGIGSALEAWHSWLPAIGLVCVASFMLGYHCRGRE